MAQTNRDESLYNWLIPQLAAGQGGVQISTPRDERAAEDATWNELMQPGGIQEVLARASEPMKASYQPPARDRMISPGVTWKPEAGEVDGWERNTGSDWSMEVSPTERHSWYTDPKMGYGGDSHQQYIRNAESLLDVPLIPANYVQSLGVMIPGEGGDVTPRQFLLAAPQIAQWAAFKRAVDDPSPENKKAFADIVAYNQAPKEQLPEGANELLANPYSAAAWAELTGQVYDKKDGFAGDIARSFIQGLESGRTGGQFEDDPSRTVEEHEQLRQQYGEQADRMLTEGGTKNAKREAAFDFFSALQNGQEYTPQLDNISMGMALVAPGLTRTPGGKDRWETLMQPSAMKGRMEFANDRLGSAMGAFAKAENNPGQPFVLEAQNTNRLDPGSFAGLYNLAGNSSWGYGKVQNAFEPVFGELGARSFLKDDMLDQRPLEFFQYTNDRVFREVPLRPSWQTPSQFKETRDFAQDRRQANNDYLDTFRPQFADWYNANVVPLIPQKPMDRTYPTAAGSAAMNIVPGTFKSVAQAGMTLGGLGVGAAVGGAANAAKAFPLEMAKEALIDEPLEDAVIDPKSAAGMFEYKTQNAWMRPDRPGTMVMGDDGKPRRRTQAEYASMLDPRNRDAWNKGVEETNNTRTRELEDQYRQWQLNNK